MEHHLTSTVPKSSTKDATPVFVDGTAVAGKTSGSKKLNDTWVAWAHLPHDTDWSVRSYKELCEFSTIEETCCLVETIPDNMIQNCMLFVMRKGIDPLWEHPRNRMGGSFSYKIDTSKTPVAWRELLCCLVGEVLVKSDHVGETITGITISPKRNFCIVKIWLSTCVHQNPKIITTMNHIKPDGCLFKRHQPEY